MGEGVHFDGVCTICGWRGRFVLEGLPRHAPRDFRCSGCRASVVYQAEAAAILDQFERGRHLSLDELVRSPTFVASAILHIGRTGPVRNRLRQLDDYTETQFDPDVPLGQIVSESPLVRNEDHAALRLPDARFDLMVSSHVLEHVPGWKDALSEGFRVLRGGGSYVFSIPGRALPERSRTRATLDRGGIVHQARPRFHNSPEGTPALVFTDFGQDLVDELEELGFVASVRRPHRTIQAATLNFVVVATKPPPRRPARAQGVSSTVRTTIRTNDPDHLPG